jgi:hypothetical protein
MELTGPPTGVDAQPGSHQELAKSVTFSPGTLAGNSPGHAAEGQRPKSAGGSGLGSGSLAVCVHAAPDVMIVVRVDASPDRYSSSQTAFEAFRAQMEADRAEVGIQLGRLGLAHQPASSSARAHAPYRYGQYAFIALVHLPRSSSCAASAPAAINSAYYAVSLR